MNNAETATAIQPCPKCGTPLEVKRNLPGTWVACPGCGQPVQVRRRVPVRPPEPEPVAEIPEIAWVEDPRTAATATAAATAISTPFASAARPESSPRYGESRRRQRRPILMLALIAGIANAVFAGLCLPVSTTEEVLIAGGFGVLLGLFVASMAASAVRKQEAR